LWHPAEPDAAAEANEWSAIQTTAWHKDMGCKQITAWWEDKQEIETDSHLVVHQRTRFQNGLNAFPQFSLCLLST
jgi:hypothetical protein